MQTNIVNQSEDFYGYLANKTLGKFPGIIGLCLAGFMKQYMLIFLLLVDILTGLQLQTEFDWCHISI